MARTWSFVRSLDSPIVNVKNDLIPTEQNQNVTLECSIISRPMARTSWEKNGQRLADNQIVHTRINQTMSTSRLRVQVCRERDESLLRDRYSLQMNDDDDFGQYTCVAENTHGRTEGIVFVLRELSLFYSMTLKRVSSLLEESTVPSTLPTTMITPRKTSRYSKYSLSRTMNSTRTYFDALTSTTAYVERDIRLSSSATRPWCSSLWIFLWIRLKDLQRWTPSFTHVCVWVTVIELCLFFIMYILPLWLLGWHDVDNENEQSRQRWSRLESLM